MHFNLRHPDNAYKKNLVQYQHTASIWANDLSRGTISRSRVAQLINEHPPQAQKTLKYWLNTYRAAIKKRELRNINVNGYKPRAVRT